MCPEVVTRWAVLTQRLSPDDEPKTHQVVKNPDRVAHRADPRVLLVLPAHRDLGDGPTQPAGAQEHLRVEPEAQGTQRLEARHGRFGGEGLETALRVVQTPERRKAQEPV